MVRPKDKKEEKEKYAQWKQNLPIMYDWIMNHPLTWPSQSCRWGPQEEDTQKYKRKQKLYLSDRTDGTELNKLSVWTVEIIKARVAAAENMRYDESLKSPLIKPEKTILHPGEVNKIREVPQHPHILVTHTDAKELYVWNVLTQPNRAFDKGESKSQLSQADLVLRGHTEDAKFAVAISSAEPLVASGGDDTQVLIWDLRDHEGGSWLTMKEAEGRPPSNEPFLNAKLRLQGHTNVVEDLVWQPGSAAELASVGDDYKLLFWDTRAGTVPAASLEDAHGKKDLHCVDWSSLQLELLVTGAADGTVRVWDRRHLSAPLFDFRPHDKPIIRVEWAPYKKGVFASGGEDQMIAVWDLERSSESVPSAVAAAPAAEEEKAQDGKKKPTLPPQLIFQHAGHRSQVVDFQWHATDPYTMASVSDSGEGSTLQAWRISDMIWRPIDVVLAELEQHRDFIVTGKETSTSASRGGHTTGTAQDEGELELREAGVQQEDTVLAEAATPGATKEEAAEELANAMPLDQATMNLGRPVNTEKEAEPYKAAEADVGPVKMES
ncbi:hypothetical protein CVIRNUC_002468 [Coccomyxa viridis]|uniref:Histone-binding protein RBBP4-like N-terminal domain-containing protein n=1 Tax=Coccomyxa viridis TaxID=1274662 RepID=A0AAV1HVZ7_9CHLO|nr:hypothetical protein CVIRNUC_002468 [Coccomyxa viridis]